MSHRLNLPARFCIFALVALFAATPAAADRPSRDENDKAGKHEKNKHEKRKQKHDKDSRHESEKSYFNNDNRRIVNDYYGARFRSGKCPPGLARKNNGCLPPGQAKKWAIGQPLPEDLKRYNLPRDLLARLPAPPNGHSYVRIASDILLIAVGTGMVVDAIEDIGRQL